MVLMERANASFQHHRESEIHRRKLHHAQRRFVLLAAGIVGVLAGSVAVGFEYSVHFIELIGVDLSRSLSDYGPLGWACLLSIGGITGGLAGWLTQQFAPEAGGSGIPHVKAVLLNMRRLRPLVLIPVKIGGGLLALLPGLSLGREGPTIQIGAAIGQLAAKVGKAPRRSYPILIAAGAGAGLAAAFNAPLAGFIFVMEELKREMSPITYGAALISSVAAVAIARIQLGQGASFHLANPSPVPMRALPLVVVLGLLAAFSGVLFNKITIGLILIRERMKVSRGLAGATVGMLAAACLVLLPQITGGGHRVAEAVLSGGMDRQFAIGFVAVLFVGKLMLTSSSFATGLPGGIFAPILVIGALLGYFCGSIFATWFPGLNVSPHVFATIGMVSLLAASVRAPLTGVVLIVEMTQQYSLLYALLLGAFVSYVVADLLRDKPIYEALLEHDLHKSGELGSLTESTVPLDLVVEPDSYMDGRRIKDLGLLNGALIVTIEREGGYIIPNGSTRMKYGDRITVIIGGEQSEEATLRVHDAARAP